MRESRHFIKQQKLYDKLTKDKIKKMSLSEQKEYFNKYPKGKYSKIHNNEEYLLIEEINFILILFIIFELIVLFFIKY